jgi:hypothetical protein
MNPLKASRKVFFSPFSRRKPEPEPDAEPPDAAAPTTRSEKRTSLIVAVRPLSLLAVRGGEGGGESVLEGGVGEGGVSLE